jgi:hypothetical protein
MDRALAGLALELGAGDPLHVAVAAAVLKLAAEEVSTMGPEEVGPVLRPQEEEPAPPNGGLEGRFRVQRQGGGADGADGAGFGR